RRGLEGENRVLIEQALARTHTLPKLEGRAALQQTNLIAKTWLVLAFLSFSQGDSTRAVFATRKCAQLARQTGDKSLLARALGFEYSSKMALGDPVDVDTILNEGLVAARESGEPFANGMLLGMVGTRMMMVGQDLETAQSYIEQGLALLKESDNRWGFTMILLSMAIALKYMHRFAEARSNLAICFPIFQEMGDRHRVNMVKSELAHMEREEGHYETAEQMYRGTIMEWQRLGHRAAVAHQLECLAFLAKVQENGEHAATLFGAAEALREQIEISMTVVERVEYDREVADLRAGMDKSAFESAWTQGRAMTMDEAIGYALHGQI
ncbi:MAG TPA: hypothetical protein VFO91_15030, partial [Anaerolineales bacterium]|nr:hypothetical protein [Anaerolineales bacterium]